MQKVTIYRFSKNPRWENTYDNHSWFEVNEPLYDDDEFYLFREVWKLDNAGDYQCMVDNDFVKVVSKKWLGDHNLYYGCRILNDADYSDDGITEYDKETQNIQNILCR